MNNIIKAVNTFLPDEKILSCENLGNGHINSTFLVTTDKDQYSLQIINTNIFKDVDGLMSNLQKVTHHIRKKAKTEGDDPQRATLRFLPAPDGKRYLLIGDKAYRMYKYIDHVITIKKMENPEHFYSAGVAFGNFAQILSDFDASELVETIKNFHNTVSRETTSSFFFAPLAMLQPPIYSHHS